MTLARRFSGLISVCLGVLLAVGGNARAAKPARRQVAPQNPALDLSTYSQDLNRWIAAVKGVSANPKSASSVAAQVPLSISVEAGGVRSTISMRWLRRDLANIPKAKTVPAEALRPTLDRLKGMEREAQRLGSPPDPDLKSAPQELRKILASSEFVIRPKPPKTWLDKLEERVGKWLDKIFGPLGAKLTGHPTLVKAVLWTLLVGFGAMLFISMFLWLVRRPAPARLVFALGPEGAAPTWQSLLRSAKNAAGRGEFRDAIRLAHSAAIFRLEALGMWTVDHARTHREYLRLLDSSQPAREPLERLTRQFELAWFGGRPASLPDFENALTQLEKLGCA